MGFSGVPHPVEYVGIDDFDRLILYCQGAGEDFMTLEFAKRWEDA